MRISLLLLAALLSACSEKPAAPAPTVKTKTAEELQWEREDAIAKKAIADWRLQKVMDRAAEEVSARESESNAIASRAVAAEIEEREAKRKALFAEGDRKRQADMDRRERERQHEDLLQAVKDLRRR